MPAQVSLFEGRLALCSLTTCKGPSLLGSFRAPTTMHARFLAVLHLDDSKLQFDNRTILNVRNSCRLL